MPARQAASRSAVGVSGRRALRPDGHVRLDIRLQCSDARSRSSAQLHSAGACDPGRGGGTGLISWSGSGRRACSVEFVREHGRPRRRSRSEALHRARPPADPARCAGRDTGSRLGDRRDGDIPARVEREPRRALRDEPPQRPRRRPGAHGRRRAARLLAGGGGFRAEHDHAQLRPHARLRPRSRRRGRDRRHPPRPRRQRRAVARAGARSGSGRADGRLRRRVPARSHRPRGERYPDARTGRRLPARVERGRDGNRSSADRRPRPRGRRARLGGRRPLRAARPDRRRRDRRRRPPLLAVQVLRPAPRPRSSGGARCSSGSRPTRSVRRQTIRSALASRPARSPTRRSPAFSPASSTCARSAGTRSSRTSGSSRARFLDGLAERYRLYGPQGLEGRVPTFALTHPTLSPEEVAEPPRRARHRRLARQLLRGRGHGPAGPFRTAQFASASSTTTRPPRSTACSRSSRRCSSGAGAGRSPPAPSAAERGPVRRMEG